MNNEEVETKSAGVADAKRGFSTWADELAQLLEQARLATEAADAQACVLLAEQLAAFVTRSHTATPPIAALDDVAIGAGRAMAESVRDRAAQRMESRAKEWSALGKALGEVRVESDLPPTPGVAEFVAQLAKIAADAREFARRIDRASISDAEQRLDALAIQLRTLADEFRDRAAASPASDGTPTGEIR